MRARQARRCAVQYKKPVAQVHVCKIVAAPQVKQTRQDYYVANIEMLMREKIEELGLDVPR